MSDTVIGYKVMRFDEGRLVSGADSRQNFNLKVGETMSMPGNGIYLGVDKQYVFDHYSGLADVEQMLTLEFKKSDIIVGQITDAEPELGVRQARILKMDLIIDGEYLIKPDVDIKAIKVKQSNKIK